jgi:hypothetical protein
LTVLRLEDQFVETADLVSLKINPGVFSALGVRVAKMGFATPGPVLVYSRNELGQSIVSTGRIQKSVTKRTGILGHSCYTQPGSSGAALVQDGHVVGIHTGANTEKTENQATSLRYFKTRLLGKSEESYFEDNKFDLDDANERLLEKIQAYQVAHTSDREIFEAADDLWSEIERLRYGPGIYDADEIDQRLARINAGEATEKDVRDYLHKQSGVAFSSKKNPAKGKESADIKEVGSSILVVTTSSKKEKSTQKGLDSSTSAELERSEPEEEKKRVPSSSGQDLTVSLLKDLQTQLTLLSTKLSDSETQIAEMKRNSKASVSKPQPTPPSNNVNSKVSKEAIKKPSKAT